jgi:N-acyl-phosphatidylethanolamine-hydrolysing phospholipase D
MDDPALLYAPHGAPGKFWNPWAPMTTGVLDVLRWKLRKNPYDKRQPLHIPVVENDGAYLAAGSAPPSLTWVGHSTFAIQDGGEVFVTDPHWGPRALLPARQSPPGIPLAAIPPHATALLSHNHYDHLDAWTVERLPQSVRWFVPRGVGVWFRQRRSTAGLDVVELDWWESAPHGRFTLTCLPAQHWSNRLDVGRNASLWCSWLLTGGERSYYFAGDSGYFHGFAEFGRRFGPVDAALLPIGAYEPRWFMRPQHMDPGEALRAFRDLGARHMVGMHWGAFDLTDEPVDLAPRVLAEEVARSGDDPGRVHVLAVGERFPIP